ncbi:MAG: hypothetical protein M3Z01_01880 [Thermoproteota archaeon]|nr:hypothetical protein [Thermoproteota archaeon]
MLSSCYLASAVIIVLIISRLSLHSEAGHMLVDVGGLDLALFAINYNASRQFQREHLATLEWKYGHHLPTA